MAKLTGEQKQVVEHQGGHAKVMAVAGSGKTTTMICRVIHLIKQGVNPRRILILMFNDSAAKEFAARLKRASENLNIQQVPEVRTFHSLGNKLCRRLVHESLLPDWPLITEDWKYRKAASDTLKPFMAGQRGKDAKETEEAFYRFIDLVKSDLSTPAEKMQALRKDFDERLPTYFPKAYEAFEQKRRAAGIRFFSDLIGDPIRYLVDNPEHQSLIADKFDHIICDEYQDINEIQQRLVKITAGTRAQVTCVGDCDQTIYEWRGAKPAYIVSLFERDFPGATTYTLSRTFRYGHSLSLMANNVITVNEQRDDKICVSADNNFNTKVIAKAEGRRDNQTAQTLIDWRDSGRPLAQAAILVRHYSMTIPVELALLHAGIPYQLKGASSQFDRNEILLLLGVLHLIADNFSSIDDKDYLIRMVSVLLKIPYMGIRSEQATQIATRLSKDPGNLQGNLLATLDDLAQRHNDKKLNERLALFRMLVRKGAQAKASDTLNRFINQAELFSYFQWSEPTREKADDKERMVLEFVSYAGKSRQSAEGLTQACRDLARTAMGLAQEVDRVLITSIHRSKGLEWPLVIIPSLEEGVFPSQRAKRNLQLEEAERRLFYVGATRAIENLVLVHPKDDNLASWKRTDCRPHPIRGLVEASRFVYEAAIPEACQLGRAISRKGAAMVPISSGTLYERYLRESDNDQRVIITEEDEAETLNL